MSQNPKAKRYQDYVIKDGKLVGEFEKMYQESNEIPWHLDKVAYTIFSDLDITILKYFHKLYQFSSLLQVGSALGFFTDRLSRELGDGVQVTGIDISPTAVKKSSEKFPHIDFKVADMIKDDFSNWEGKFDLVIEKEVLWYILADVECFFKNMRKMTRRYIYISQAFPDSSNFLGSDVFPNAEALYCYVKERFNVLYSAIERDQQYGNRELIHIIAEKKCVGTYEDQCSKIN